MRLVSLEGKLTAALAAMLIAAAALAAAATYWLKSPWYGATAAVLVLAMPAIFFARALAQPVAALIRALSGSVVAFRDGDFSFSIGAKRGDEVGELVAAHNELGRVLREERQHLFQRELLLDTVVQNTPTALALVEEGGHVVYANIAARQLLNGGRTLNGELFDEIIAERRPSRSRARSRAAATGFSACSSNTRKKHSISRSARSSCRAGRTRCISSSG